LIARVILFEEARHRFFGWNDLFRLGNVWWFGADLEKAQFWQIFQD